MRRRIPTASALLVLSAAFFYQVGCGGGGSSPVSATPPSGGGGNGGSVISIVANAGNQSFSPNPASIPNGGSATFRNADSTTHHIVANDGSFDTGNLVPGASSAAMGVESGTIQYHCTIHPTMVGSINGSTANGPTGPGY